MWSVARKQMLYHKERTAAGNWADLQVNTEKFKFTSRPHNAGRRDDIKIATRAFENFAKLKHCGRAVTMDTGRGGGRPRMSLPPLLGLLEKDIKITKQNETCQHQNLKRSVRENILVSVIYSLTCNPMSYKIY